ncbi:MAG: heat-inducible transcriptional repressor HrcA [Acidimicrobiia bacterium]|nr:heat-inducible transcriptional repressor HrcA [Acidimicrobiia bacterium]
MSAETRKPVIDERKAAVLRAIVEEYVATAQPVGSQTIAQGRELGVSAATVRNDMGVLEREGFIAQPHTSAGRVPTDLGYRYYVDHFASGGLLTPPERREISSLFHTTGQAIEELLHDTSQLLARLTDHAAVVVGPQMEAVRVRSAQVVMIQPRTLLVVVVLSNGAVEKETLNLGEDVADSVVDDASARLGLLLTGRVLAEIEVPEQDEAAPPDPAAEIVSDACRALSRRAGAGEPLFVGGVSHIAAEQEAFPTAATPARLLDLLEQHAVVISVVRELLGPGLTVRIGTEHERDDLRECSLVLAPYLVEGEPAGSVGLLGPTRMDYRRAHAAVTAVSRMLGRRLTS